MTDQEPLPEKYELNRFRIVLRRDGAFSKTHPGVNLVGGKIGLFFWDGDERDCEPGMGERVWTAESLDGKPWPEGAPRYFLEGCLVPAPRPALRLVNAV